VTKGTNPAPRGVTDRHAATACRPVRTEATPPAGQGGPACVDDVARQAFVERVRAFVHEIPKVELHCHLLGTVRRETLTEWVARAGAPISGEEIESYYTRGEKPVGVLRVLRALEQQLLASADDLYRLTVEYLESAAAHAVRHAEFSWNPTGCVCDAGITYRGGLDAIVAAMRDAQRQWGIEARMIAAIDREATPAAMTGREFVSGHGGVDDPLSQIDADHTYPVRAAAEFATGEHARAVAAVDLLRSGSVSDPTDIAAAIGDLMHSSHLGYSGIGLGAPQTDAMVEELRRRGRGQGFFGARVSGGGCGGTVVVLLAESALPALHRLAADMTGTSVIA